MPIHARGFQFEAGEFGVVDIDDYVGRLDVLDQPRAMAAVVADYFWNTTPAPAVIPYAWLNGPVRFRADQPINDPAIGITGTSGTSRAPNATSITQYGDYTAPATLSTAISADADVLAGYLSANYSGFRMRCPSLTINLLHPARTSTDLQLLLGITIGTRLTISGAPAQWPEGTSSLIVEGISHQVAHLVRLVTFNTSPVIQPTPNYLNANALFESGIGNWAANNGATLASSGTQKYQGALAMSITPDGVSANPGAEASQVPVTPGRTYVASVWLWSTAAFTWGVGISWYDSSHVWTGVVNKSSVTLLPGVWTQVTGSFTAISNAGFGALLIEATGTPAASNVLYADMAGLFNSNSTAGQVFVQGPWFRWGSSAWGSSSDLIPF